MSHKFKISRGLDIGQPSYMVRRVLDQFSIEPGEFIETIEGELALPDEWNVGLIVGRSGTGKTSIARELFPDQWRIVDRVDNFARTIIDAMPRVPYEEVTEVFNNVGFSSPPSWLKPYGVLSNGEKMRAQIAHAILSDDPFIVFDEFTSVVDRQVAKIVSYCAQKAVRKRGKQFVAVTCHEDVEEWLLPDWVFNTNTMTFHANPAGLKKNRPGVKLEIYRTERKAEAWNVFKKYHYLSHEHNNSAAVYTAYADGVLCGFCSIFNFPHATVKRAKRFHRIVVLPDFQGLGIGTALMEEVARIYDAEGFNVYLTTSSPAFIKSLAKRGNWSLRRADRRAATKSSADAGRLARSSSSNRFTTSWKYEKDSNHSVL